MKFKKKEGNLSGTDLDAKLEHLEKAAADLDVLVNGLEW